MLLEGVDGGARVFRAGSFWGGVGASSTAEDGPPPRGPRGSAEPSMASRCVDCATILRGVLGPRLEPDLVWAGCV